MKVFLTSDHGGFELKNKLFSYLTELGFDAVDLGPKTLDPNDDYPLYAEKLAKEVVKNPDFLGIISCRNGVGISIAANKVDGIRSALSWDPKHAMSARKDDDANVLSLPSDYISEEVAKSIAKAFLETRFIPEERFIRRINEIERIEDSQ